MASVLTLLFLPWVLLPCPISMAQEMVAPSAGGGVGAVGGDGRGGGGRGSGGTKELVPAMFIFGDSLIDNGNNNNLPSFAKANYYPYGIDFPGGPTGRFCNGLTMADAVANLLGLPLIPAHSEASGDAILHGINYASAAAGILDDTGRNFVGRIPFNQQIQNFQGTLEKITARLGASNVGDALSRCIFFIGMGSNDYLNNYLMPNFDTRNHYNGEQFADLLVHQYSQQLRRLYNLGARRFVLSGVGSLGCIPSLIAQRPDNKCNREVDQTLVFPFNNKVKVMVNSLNANLPGSKLIFIDIYRLFMDVLTNSRSYGFSNVDTGCCGVGKNRGQITCLPLETPCSERDRYVFWDAFHPTEAVNLLTARRAFYADTDVVFPVNIQQLAKLDLRQPN